MPFSIIPFLLLIIPLAEIAVFVAVGSQIGVLAAIGLVLATAIAGSILLRVQGFGAALRVRRGLAEGRMPGRDLVHGVMILLAGILLLMPGFITDTIGFLLFIPALRDLGWSFLRDRIVVVGGNMRGNEGKGPRTGAKTIDLDMDEYSSSPNDESPWNPPRNPRE